MHAKSAVSHVLADIDAVLEYIHCYMIEITDCMVEKVVLLIFKYHLFLGYYN